MIKKPETEIKDILMNLTYLQNDLEIYDRSVLMTLLCLDENYYVSSRALSRLLKFDSEAITASLKRLEENGYLIIRPVNRRKKDIDLTPLDEKTLSWLFFNDQSRCDTIFLSDKT